MKITLKNKDKIICALGVGHPCRLNVNGGYCIARECQFQVGEGLKEYQPKTNKTRMIS